MPLEFFSNIFLLSPYSLYSSPICGGKVLPIFEGPPLCCGEVYITPRFPGEIGFTLGFPSYSTLVGHSEGLGPPLRVGFPSLGAFWLFPLFSTYVLGALTGFNGVGLNGFSPQTPFHHILSSYRGFPLGGLFHALRGGCNPSLRGCGLPFNRPLVWGGGIYVAPPSGMLRYGIIPRLC